MTFLIHLIVLFRKKRFYFIILPKNGPAVNNFPELFFKAY